MGNIEIVSWLVVVANYIVFAFSSFVFVRTTILDFIDWYHEVWWPTSVKKAVVMNRK
jgi:hypothetical protein